MIYAINNTILDSATSGVYITSLQNDTSSPLIINSLQVGRKAGQKIVSAVNDQRTLDVAGTIIGSSMDDTQNKFDNFKLLVSGANIPFDINNGTTSRRYYVILNGSIKVNRLPHEINILHFSLQFVVSDPPYGYNSIVGSGELWTNAITASGINQDSIIFTPTISGSTSPKATTTITLTQAGLVNNMELIDRINSRTLSVSGLSTSVSGLFNSGDIISIDSTNKKVTLNQIPINYQGQFPEFQPGSNSIELDTFTINGLNVIAGQYNSNHTYPILGTSNIIGMYTTLTGNTNPISRISLVLANVGTGANFTFALYYGTTSGYSGTAITGSTQTIYASNLTNIPNWYNINFSPPLTPTANQIYWMVLTPLSDDQNNYTNIYTYNPHIFPNGNSATWINGNPGIFPGDFAFRLMVGSLGDTNNTIDYNSNEYSENFSSNNYKDATNTTANWNTSGPYLTMNPETAYSDTLISATGGNYAGLSGAGGQTLVGVVYTVPTTGNLNSISLWLYRGTATANIAISVMLYSHNSNNLAVLYQTSTTTIQQSSLTTSSTEYTFDFNYPVTAGQVYDVVVEYPGTTNEFVYIENGNYTSEYIYNYSLNSNPPSVYNITSNASFHFSSDISYTVYTTQQQAQSTQVDSTQADILAVSQVTTSTLLNGANYSGQYSVDGGSTWYTLPRDNNPFETINVPTTVNNQLKMKWLLQSPSSTPPYIYSTGLYYIKGVSLDATTKVAAQSIVPSATENVQRIDIYGMSTGSPGNITISIQTDNAGVPSGTLANANATKTLANGFIYTPGWTTFNFTSGFVLTGGVKYWIIVTVSSADNSDKILLIYNNNQYPNGTGAKSTNSGTNYTVFSSNEDMIFQFYTTAGNNFAANLSLDYVARYL